MAKKSPSPKPAPRCQVATETKRISSYKAGADLVKTIK
jgi:hypothetical protein